MCNKSAEKTNDEDFFLSLVRPCVKNLEPYNPGMIPEGSIRLCSNESARGASPAALKAMTEALNDCSLYSESTCLKLRQAIADRYGLTQESILVGNGLDGVFTNLGRTFLNGGDEVISAELTFSAYHDTAEIMGAVPVKVPLNYRMEFDSDCVINAVTERTKMIFWCNPNNPTGTVVPISEIVRVLDSVPQNVIFVLDEAYFEFAETTEESGIELIKKYKNLIVCRTFSKIHGLAGLRIGWAAANPLLIKQMYRTREPYCVTEAAQAGALAALADREYFDISRRIFIEERKRLEKFFTELGVKFIPSQANFILLKEERAEDIYMALAQKNIITRLVNFRGKKLLRITVGTERENDFLMKESAIFSSKV